MFNLHAYTWAMVFLFGVFSFTWSTDNWYNCLIKLFLVGITIWGCDGLYNHRISTSYLITVVLVLFYSWIIWSKKSINLFLKWSFLFLAVYGVGVIFTHHMF